MSNFERSNQELLQDYKKFAQSDQRMTDSSDSFIKEVNARCEAFYKADEAFDKVIESPESMELYIYEKREALRDIITDLVFAVHNLKAAHALMDNWVETSKDQKEQVEQSYSNVKKMRDLLYDLTGAKERNGGKSIEQYAEDMSKRLMDAVYDEKAKA